MIGREEKRGGNPHLVFGDQSHQWGKKKSNLKDRGAVIILGGHGSSVLQNAERKKKSKISHRRKRGGNVGGEGNCTFIKGLKTNVKRTRKINMEETSKIKGSPPSHLGRKLSQKGKGAAVKRG